MVEEKREHPRQSQQGPIHVDILEMSDQKLQSSVRFEGAMKDISQSGIRLHGKHPISRGSTLELMVEVESSRVKYSLKGNVKWVSETTEHEYVAGLEIDADSRDFANWKNSFK
jgi:Tfp pilus assembly protein PilZ